MELAELNAVLKICALFVDRGCAAKLEKSPSASKVKREQSRLVRSVFRVAGRGALAGRGKEGLPAGAPLASTQGELKAASVRPVLKDSESGVTCICTPPFAVCRPREYERSLRRPVLVSRLVCESVAG